MVMNPQRLLLCIVEYNGIYYIFLFLAFSVAVCALCQAVFFGVLFRMHMLSVPFTP